MLQRRPLERMTRRRRWLTEADEALHQSMGPLFAALHHAHEEAVEQRSGVASILRIASPYEFGAHHVAPVATAMMQA